MGKVDKINIGDSQEQVIEILGEPYEKSDNRFEYYSNDYIKLVEQIKKLTGNSKNLTTNMAKDDDWDIDWDEDIDLDEDIDIGDNSNSSASKLDKLYAQLEEMTYKYIRVEFDSHKNVSEIFFDNDKCDSRSAEENIKQVKNYDVQGNTSLQQYDILNLIYSVKYNDESLFKGSAINQMCSDTSVDNAEWKDRYGNEYSIKISVTPITRLTSEIVTLIAGGDKSILKEFEITSYITSIDGDAFNGCSNLSRIHITDIASWCAIEFGDYSANPLYYAKELYLNNELVTDLVIPSVVTSISKYAFYNCSSLTSIVIPSSVTSIGRNAFEGCGSLIIIDIFGSNISYQRSSLTIYCEPKSKPSGWDSNWNSSNCPVVWNFNNNDVASDGNIYYVADNGIRYALKDGNATIAAQSVSLSGSVAIPSQVIYKGKTYYVTSIGSYAFYNCSKLTIYCEAESKPSGWDDGWNILYNIDCAPVVWGYKG